MFLLYLDFFGKSIKPYIRKISTRTPEHLCVKQATRVLPSAFIAARRPYANPQVIVFRFSNYIISGSSPFSRARPTAKKPSDSVLETSISGVISPASRHKFPLFKVYCTNYSTTILHCQQNDILIYNMLTISLDIFSPSIHFCCFAIYIIIMIVFDFRCQLLRHLGFKILPITNYY